MDVEEAMEHALPRRFAVLHSADADEVRHFVSRVLTPYRVTPVHGLQEVVSEISIADLGPVSLIHLRHSGDELRAQFTELVSYYDVHLPLAGENLLECGEDRVILHPWEKAGIISPQMRANMHLSDGYTQLHIRIERFALERRLEIMLGRPVLAPVRFQLEMDLTAPALASLFRAVNLLIQDLEEPGGLGTRGDGAGPWAEFIITGLLLAQPHNYSEAVALADATRTLPARVYASRPHRRRAKRRPRVVRTRREGRCLTPLPPARLQRVPRRLTTAIHRAGSVGPGTRGPGHRRRHHGCRRRLPLGLRPRVAVRWQHITSSTARCHPKRSAGRETPRARAADTPTGRIV